MTDRRAMLDADREMFICYSFHETMGSEGQIPNPESPVKLIRVTPHRYWSHIAPLRQRRHPVVNDRQRPRSDALGSDGLEALTVRHRIHRGDAGGKVAILLRRAGPQRRSVVHLYAPQRALVVPEIEELPSVGRPPGKRRAELRHLHASPRLGE